MSLTNEGLSKINNVGLWRINNGGQWRINQSPSGKNHSCICFHLDMILKLKSPWMKHRSPFTRRGNGKSYGDLSVPESDISFISSGRPSIDRIFPSLYDNNDPTRTPPRLSNFSDMDYSSNLDQSSNYGRRSVDLNSPTDFSTGSLESERFSSASQSIVRPIKYHRVRSIIN